MTDLWPFTWRQSADDVLAGVDLSEKRAIVTGASAGIGFETARALAAAGATVVVPCRTAARADEACAHLRAALPAGHFEAATLDLSVLASVKSFVDAQRGTPIDMLICNAGLLPNGYTESVDGIEICMAVCHFGHFVLVTSLLDEVRTARGRVVVVSSESHRAPAKMNFNNFPPRKKGFLSVRAYGQAKLANVLFAKELQRRLDKEGADVCVTALHPGAFIPTSIARNSLLAGLVFWAARPWTKSIAQGASTTVLAAASPLTADFKGEYLQDNARHRASREACNPDVAARLWAATEAELRNESRKGITGP